MPSQKHIPASAQDARSTGGVAEPKLDTTQQQRVPSESPERQMAIADQKVWTASIQRNVVGE
jgi:hypothetical protein